MVDDVVDEPSLQPKKKRRKPVDLANMTVKWLEDRGWCAGIVERRFGKFNHDFKGCVDILALKAGRPTIGVQVCRDTTLAEHREKLIHGVMVDRKVQGVVTRVLDDRAPKGCRQIILAGGMVLLVAWDTRKDPAPRFVKKTGRLRWQITHLEWVKLCPPPFDGLVVVPVMDGEGDFA